MSISFEEDDDKYDSKPLEKAKKHVEWVYKERKVDKSLRLGAKIMQKLKFMIQDFLEFMKDIASLKFNRIIVKMKEFYKRNRNRSKTVWNTIKHELHKLKVGFQEFWKDTKYYFK
jgi:hypothetical protein